MIPAPDINTVYLALVGVVSSVLGILSWKLEKRKKARLAKQTEELK